MKILMTVIMTMAMTSTFAGECKLNGECKVEADCKSLNAGYAIAGGKCINPASKETDTQCAGIVSSAGAKGSTTDAAAAGAKASDNAAR